MKTHDCQLQWFIYVQIGKGCGKTARGLPKVQSGAGLELEMGNVVYGTAVHLERWLMHDIRVAQALMHLTYFHGLGDGN